MLYLIRPFQLVLVFALFFQVTLAHIALWHPAMYGWDPSNINQNDAVTPLANLPFSQWWFHGYINIPPAPGAMMNLPSGGTYHGQAACNKAQTSYGDNSGTEYACDTIGPLHTSDAWASPDPKDVKGCGIAIAYESDVTKVKPEDFAVISVNYTCPWKKNVDFQIPSDLPACPEGGCHCMWGWVHNSDSGSEQMYFVGYRCNITGATGTQAIPSPKTANKCNYPTDTSNCTVGAKQPHYWLQSEGNNNFQGVYDPPFYNDAYGFMDGAQTDIFAALGGSSGSSTALSLTTQSSTTGSPASSSTTASLPIAAMSSSTTETSVTITTTTAAQAVSTKITTTLAEPSTSTRTTTTTVSTPSPSSTHASCQRRRRALDNLSNPSTLRRHRERQVRRSVKRKENSQDISRFAMAQKEWREARERFGQDLRSRGTAQS